MKLLATPLVLTLLAGLDTSSEELVFAPEEGTQLTRTFEASADYDPAEVSISMNGEELDLEDAPQGYPVHFEERIVVKDRIEGVEDGRPSAVVRLFVDLSQETKFSLEEEQVEELSTSDLEGRTVRFAWDDEEEEFVAEVADEEDELDEDVLEWLLEDLDLRGILPDEKVEEGDEWEFDPAVYLAFMWPSGLLDFHVEEQQEGPGDIDREIGQDTIEGIEGTGKARFDGVREEDGVRVAVLQVEMSIETGADLTLNTEDGDEVEMEVAIERDLTGEILWDLEHGHFHSAELEGSSVRTTTRTGSLEHPEAGAVEVEEVQRTSGTVHYSAKVERE